MHIPKKEFIIVLFVAIFSTLVTSSNYVSQAIRAPKDHVFVGLPTYFEDYYYYLDQFYQGKEGNWLTENKFSIEKFKPTLIYFNHLLFGKIGGLFGMESFTAFNFFGIGFKFLFILSSYFLIRKLLPKSFIERICAYLIFLYSTSLPNIIIQNGKIVFNRAIDVFRTENRIMARFGTSPNGMFINFLFIILTLYFIKKFENFKSETDLPNRNLLSRSGNILEYVIIGILFFFMTVADFTKSLLLLGTVLLLFINIYWKSLLSNQFMRLKLILGLLSLEFVIVLSYVYFSVDGDPVYKAANAWDIAQYLQQIKAIGLLKMLQGFGLQLPLFCCGFILLIRKQGKSLLEIVMLLITGSALLGYIIPLIYNIPIPGFRLLFPAIYVFISVFVLKAIQLIAQKMHTRNAFKYLMIAYLVLNGITIVRGVYGDIQPLQEPDYHFAYIPNELFDALKFLRTAEPLDGNVLSSAKTSIDLMIPGIAGRYTYTGHFLTVYNSKVKDENSNNFFYKWTDRPGTHTFLKANNIRFIVVTKYSEVINEFKTYYPFLKPIYENPTVTIFKYDPQNDS